MLSNSAQCKKSSNPDVSIDALANNANIDMHQPDYQLDFNNLADPKDSRLFMPPVRKGPNIADYFKTELE